MAIQKNQEYYLGLDIGTDSVGYAVTGTDYSLLKYRGEPMWGVMTFEAGNNAEATAPLAVVLTAESSVLRFCRSYLLRKSEKLTQTFLSGGKRACFFRRTAATAFKFFRVEKSRIKNIIAAIPPFTI